MKRFMLGMAAVAALALVPGCGKKDAQAPAAPVRAQGTMQPKKSADQEKPPKEAQTGAVQPAEKTQAEPQTDAAKPAEKAQAEVQAVAAKTEGGLQTTASAFDKLVAEAKTLIADKKYQDALVKLQAGLQQPALDAAQKSTLQKLIEQVKTALASGAAKDVKNQAGNLLKGVGGK